MDFSTFLEHQEGIPVLKGKKAKSKEEQRYAGKLLRKSRENNHDNTGYDDSGSDSYEMLGTDSYNRIRDKASTKHKGLRDKMTRKEKRNLESQRKEINRRAYGISKDYDGRGRNKNKNRKNDNENLRRGKRENDTPEVNETTMNFSRMKLVTEMYAQATGGGQGSLAGTKLTQAANNKASQAAQAPKAMTNTSNNIGMQQNQMSQKQGNIKAATVQKQGGAPAKAATTGSPMSTVEYFDALRARKEFNKHLTEKKSDWKKELTEALGADDEVFHPYVEVMPFKDFKQNEAKKNLAGQAMKDGAAENPAQKAVKAKMVGEERKDEKGLSDDEKDIGRSLLAGLNPVDDHMAGATRRRLALAARGSKKRKGRK